MKYVFTRKLPLVDTVYNFQTVREQVPEGRITSEFHAQFPAPKEFYIPSYVDGKSDNTKYRYTKLSQNFFQILAIWYCRGTRFVFDETYLTPSTTLQIKHPRVQWAYTMVDSLPNSYIKKGIASTQEAYDYGKALIEAVNKQNLIPFDVLEDAYKSLARECLKTGRNIRFVSPNNKTVLEAKAELEAAHDIKCIFSHTKVECNLPLEQLQFYAKVFDIKMPEWFLRASHQRFDETSAKGKSYYQIAVMPFVDATDFVSVSSGTAYAGNDFERPEVPVSILRDSQPQKLVNPEAEYNQLAEQVLFYLGLPIEQQREFMTNNYDICPDCGKIFDIREGCECGHITAMDDAEVACREYALSRALYN